MYCFRREPQRQLTNMGHTKLFFLQELLHTFVVTWLFISRCRAGLGSQAREGVASEVISSFDAEQCDCQEFGFGV